MIAEDFRPGIAKKLSIFVVEDEMILALDIQQMLRSQGFEIAGHARTGDDAVTAILSTNPDVLLMDIRLHGTMDGIEVARTVQRSKDIPIVFQTASADVATLDRAHTVNPYGFIMKPFDPFELRVTLQLAYFVHQKDKALRDSEERWKFALEGSGDGIWDYDPTQQRVVYSPRIAEILDVKTSDLGTGPAGFIERVHPEDASRFSSSMRALLRGNTETVKIEFRMRGGDGRYHWVLGRGKVMARSPHGRPLRVLGTLSDIRTQKQTESDLKRSETKYRELVETLPEIVFETDSEGQVSFANRAPLLELMHCEPADVIAQSVFDFLVPEDRPRAGDVFRTLLHTGGHRKSEYTFQTPDGTRVPVMIHSMAIMNEGVAIGLRGIVVNLSEQKDVERALRQTQQDFDVLASNMPGTDVYLLDCDFRMRLAKGSQVTGDPARTSSLVGCTLEEAFPDDLVTILLPACQRAQKGEGFRAEWCHRGVWFDIDVVPIQGADRIRSPVVVVLQNITRSKEAEISRERQLEFQQKLVDAIPMPVFFKDDDMLYLGCNLAFEELYGRRREWLVGKPVEELASPQQAALYRSQDELLMASGGTQTYESDIIDAEGRRRRVVYHKAVLPLRENGARGIIGAILDLTERFNLERTLKESEERYRAMFHNNHAVQLLLEPATLTIVDANPAAATFYGYTADQLRGLHYARIAQKTETQLAGEMRAVLARETTQLTSTHRLAHGENRDVEIDAGPVTIAGKQLLYVFVHDITPLVLARQRLQQSEERFRLISQHVTDLIVLMTEDGNILYANRGLNGNGHASPLQAGTPFFPLVANEDDERLRNEICALKETQRSRVVEFRMRSRDDDSRRHMEAILTLMASDDHENVVLVARDITERFKKEERIRIFSRALSQAREVIIITDRDGRIEYANPRFTELTGYEVPDVLGMTPRFLKSGTTSRGEYEHLWNTLLAGERWNGVFQNRRKDGGLFWERSSISPVKDADGTITHFIAVKEEIGEQVRQQEERVRLELELREHNTRLERALREKEEMQNVLVQSEKLASIGQLTAGIAHEINNPLAFVSSNLNRFQEYFDELYEMVNSLQQSHRDSVALDRSAGPGQMGLSQAQCEEIQFLVSDFKELMRNTREGATRIKNIVEQLRGFTHMAGVRFEEADINTALEDCITITWNELKYKATIKREFGDVPPVMCNIGELKQVFVNLLVNAAHALNDSGEITVRTHVTRNIVAIEVEDTGVGITEDNLKKIFDPFFTTKPVGKGTGLGLWVSATIISKHKGKIAVASVPGRGSTFTVSIPLEGNEAREEV
jgi:PAS domain S-box-containing protein